MKRTYESGATKRRKRNESEENRLKQKDSMLIFFKKTDISDIKSVDENAEVLLSFLPFYITYEVVSLITSILMALGASHGNRFFLLPWLVMEMISLVFVGLVVLIGGTYFLVIDSAARYIGVLTMCTGIPIFAVQLYMWLCVLSCFQELRDSSGFVYSTPLVNLTTEYQPPGYQRVDSGE